MAAALKPQEIEVDVISSTGDKVTLHGSKDSELRQNSPKSVLKKLNLKSVVKYLAVVLLVSGAVVAYTLTHVQQSSTVDSLVALASKKENIYDVQLDVDSKHAFQDCWNVRYKQTFPNIDFALLGYNVLKGFPLTIGHDPGFTYPIFAADFSARAISSDCRFFIPDGLLVNPDISCFLTLSTETIQTQYEYLRFLQKYTSIGGSESNRVNKDEGNDDNVRTVSSERNNNTTNQWGISFSASTGYKASSSVLSRGQFVYVFSTAKCKYYFSKLVHSNAPKFDDGFLGLINKLAKATDLDIELYFKLFDAYGTHYVKEVTFGARYTFKHKMTSEYYKWLKSCKVNVNALADYAGAKLLSEDASLPSTLQKYTQEFEDKVETTIIPLGTGPKENGSVLSWASDVQLNPLPTEYKLSSIEDLFTDTYMKHLNINYERIRLNIMKLRSQYCSHLQDIGDVESCTHLGAGVVLQKTKLLKHYKEVAVSSISNCIEKCLQDDDCDATTYCTSCQRNDNGYKKCYLFKGQINSISAIKTEEPTTIWESNIYPVKIQSELTIVDVSIIGTEIVMAEEDKRATLADCKQLCIKDAYCSVYVFIDHTGIQNRCKLYDKKQVTALQKTVDVKTFFMSIDKSS